MSRTVIVRYTTSPEAAERNPLDRSPAFAAFQEGIAERCVEGPEPIRATVVGSYGIGR